MPAKLSHSKSRRAHDARSGYILRVEEHTSVVASDLVSPRLEPRSLEDPELPPRDRFFEQLRQQRYSLS
jgi:hypothetical protein